MKEIIEPTSMEELIKTNAQKYHIRLGHKMFKDLCRRIIKLEKKK